MKYLIILIVLTQGCTSLKYQELSSYELGKIEDVKTTTIGPSDFEGQSIYTSIQVNGIWYELEDQVWLLKGDVVELKTVSLLGYEAEIICSKFTRCVDVISID